jgi:hypothetical protein
MILESCFVKELLGGEWPTVPGCEGFSWDDVAEWHCKEGVLLPSDGQGGYMIGPMLQLKPFDAEKFIARRNAELPAPVPAKPQPPPTDSNEPPVLDMVINDLRERAEDGLKKYGTYLRPHNGRDPLIDAYQESCDLCMYLRQAIAERDRRQ